MPSKFFAAIHPGRYLKTMKRPGRLPRRVSRLIAGVCALTAAALIFGLGLTLYLFLPSTHTYYVPGAQFADPDYLDKLQSALDQVEKVDPALTYEVLRTRRQTHAHRLRPGQGVIIGLRERHPGSLFNTDDEQFEQLTLWLPALPPGQRFTESLGAPHPAVALITRGGAWPDNCTWRLRQGTLTVEATPPRLGVHLTGEAELALNTPLLHRCPPRLTIDRRFSADAIPWEARTPWLGRDVTAS